MADVEKQRLSGEPATVSASGPRQALNQSAVPSRFRTFANPAPLGLFSFASTTLILSLINVNTDGVTAPNVVVGMALFVGGLCQLLAGMWEFASGNTLGATAFSSYGGFWLAYATIFIPGSGVLAQLSGTPQEAPSLGFFLATWFIFTFMMFVASLRSNFGLIALFFMLDMTFLLLMIAEYVPHLAIQKAGGVFGIITAFIAYYVGAAEMISRESHYFSLPLLPMPRRQRVD